MRISDWSSDVCSSDLFRPTSISAKSFSMATTTPLTTEPSMALEEVKDSSSRSAKFSLLANELSSARAAVVLAIKSPRRPWVGGLPVRRSGKLCPGIKRRSRGAVQASGADAARSEEHTSELQSLMRISYAVFCLKKKKHDITTQDDTSHTDHL